MILVKQMLVLFLLMVVGFVCRKIGLLNDESSKKISGLVVNVANPALILSAGINPESTIQGTEFLKTLCLALAIYACLIIISFIIPRILRVPVSERGLYKVMTIFSNIGFMGFPLISAVYGDDALLYAALFMIPYNVLIYTYGLAVIKGNAGDDSEDQTSVKDTLKKVFNVGVIACILMFVLYLTRLPVPSVIEDTVDYLSNLTAPLSMIIIGDSITKINFKKLLTNWRLIVFTLIKLVVIPVVGVLLLSLCGISGDLLGVCMIMLATPVGSMTVMLAEQYDGNTELAASGVAFTTVLSVITIPIVSLLI